MKIRLNIKKSRKLKIRKIAGYDEIINIVYAL